MIKTKKKIMSMSLALALLLSGTAFTEDTKVFADEVITETTENSIFDRPHNENELLVCMTDYTIDSEEIKAIMDQIPPFEYELIFDADQKPEDGISRVYHLFFESGYREAYEILSQYPELLIVELNGHYENAADSEKYNTDYHKGDVNGDKELNTSDYLFIKNALLAGEALETKQFVMADIDNNNKINSSDYLMLKGHFGGDVTISQDGFYNGKDVSEYKETLVLETELAIKNNYIKHEGFAFQYFPADVAIKYLSGSFNGAYVMMINFTFSDFPAVVTEITVGGVNFAFPTSQKLTVWKDGKFYSLEEAYDANILTSEDLGIANTIYCNGYAANTSGV